MRIEDLTREQAAAYVNGTCVVALSELLAMHWQNEQHKLRIAAGLIPPTAPLPCPPQMFQDRVGMHCVMHAPMLALFERAKG